MTTGQSLPLPNQPDKEQATIYRVGLEPDSRGDAVCATVVGKRGEAMELGVRRDSGELTDIPVVRPQMDVSLVSVG